MKNKNKKICIICRGIPGSGKSYTAKKVLEQLGGSDPDKHIFSTDKFFIQGFTKEQKKGLNHDECTLKEIEVYKSNFDLSKLSQAHKWNFNRFKEAIGEKTTPVIVDNTNVKLWEFENYIKEARSNGYEVILKEPDSPWWNDYRHMLDDKNNHKAELEDFARLLAGVHGGLSKKYGTSGNTHGVPLDAIRRMIRKWQPNVKI